MPLLSLCLTNTDSSNKCVVKLPHEVRTQEMKIKQTRVHFNHAKHTEATGNYYALVNRTSSDANVQHRQLEVPRTSALATVFSPANASLPVHSWSTDWPTTSAADLPMFEPGFYMVDVEAGNASVDTTAYPTFRVTFHIHAGNFSATQRILSHVQAASDHAHHRFRVVSNEQGTDFERAPPRRCARCTSTCRGFPGTKSRAT
jgi:hypothetical protein